ncbi:peptidoglycan-binding protein ArfA [Mycobacterium heckeshornense]|uniref:channel-forming protein ArfA/OmpATb n=1 Tax=Mycobacterium heckeshornense TaxID=110505 RepID=UPI001AF83EDD|nr:BON domain-containing protein [Mycobacterium heckeshornense]BCQ07687.1 peptidoglycan-binding protein ArfA [Mycobacterium heckeshornense]
MAGSGEPPANTQRRRVCKLYRRPPGIAWLVALAAIPLLLAAIGYGLAERAGSPAAGPAGKVPTLTHTGAPSAAPKPPQVLAISLAPLSIIRNGKDITLHGEFPDDMAKRALLDAVKSSVPDVNVIDKTSINPNIEALDFSDAAPVFSAAASITDFKLTVEGDTITLVGTAATADQGDAVEQAAEDAWPNLNILDKMEVFHPAPTTPATTPSTHR